MLGAVTAGQSTRRRPPQRAHRKTSMSNVRPWSCARGTRGPSATRPLLLRFRSRRHQRHQALQDFQRLEQQRRRAVPPNRLQFVAKATVGFEAEPRQGQRGTKQVLAAMRRRNSELGAEGSDTPMGVP